jgi:hypothetical protein
LMEAGVRPDPDKPPVGLEKDMSKFEVEDIPRYVEYSAVFDNWDPARERVFEFAESSL